MVEPFGQRSGAPVERQRHAQSEGGGRILVECPVDGRAQVVGIGVQPGEPGRQVPADELRLGLEREPQEEGEVAVAQLGRLIGGDQPVTRVLSNRLQQVVARRAAAVDHHERASDQATQRVERVERRVAAGRGLIGKPGNLGRRLERAPSGEHGEAPEQPPLVVGEQVPAPVDQRLEGLLPRQAPSAARR